MWRFRKRNNRFLKFQLHLHFHAQVTTMSRRPFQQCHMNVTSSGSVTCTSSTSRYVRVLDENVISYWHNKLMSHDWQQVKPLIVATVFQEELDSSGGKSVDRCYWHLITNFPVDDCRGVVCHSSQQLSTRMDSVDIFVKCAFNCSDKSWLKLRTSPRLSSKTFHEGVVN